MGMLTIVLHLRIEQIDDGTWRIVVEDVVSAPFATREDAVEAIKSISHTKMELTQ